MEWKSSISTELTSMINRNILGFITYNCTKSRRVRVTEMTVPEQHGGGNNSKGVVCGCLRSTRGKKTDDIQQPEAVIPGDHVSGSKILHK
jgi:hypothetical protein